MARRGKRAGRAAVVTGLTVIGVLALSVPALGADPPPVPKPDPPPKAAPPPPPQPSGPPAAPQPAPVAVAPAPVATPSVAQPTAAERRAAAARRAQRKAARAAKARRVAAEKLAAAHRRERAQALIIAANDSTSSGWGMPVLLVAFSVALLLLGLALVPARAVPWSRASRALDDRRDELGVMGAMGLVATFVFFLLVQVTS